MMSGQNGQAITLGLIQGKYDISNLLSGPYRIEAPKTGFSTVIKRDVVRHVQEELEMNFELDSGSISDGITVVGGAPVIELNTSAPGAVIDARVRCVIHP